jgi:hypothetical protein
MSESEVDDLKVLVTEPVRLSYPFLFVRRPKSKFEKKGKAQQMTFQCTILIPPDARLGRYKKALEAAELEMWGKKVNLDPAKFPIKDAGAKRDRNGDPIPGYEAGWRYIALHSNDPVGVVDRQCIPVLPDEDEDPNNPGVFHRSSKVYPGVWAMAYLNAYAWDFEGLRGVSFGLNGIQLVRDGDRLGGRPKPELGKVFKALGKVAGAGGGGDDDDEDEDWGNVTL